MQAPLDFDVVVGRAQEFDFLGEGLLEPSNLGARVDGGAEGEVDLIVLRNVFGHTRVVGLADVGGEVERALVLGGMRTRA